MFLSEFLGTGALCVYPIIGARKNAWSFLATEADATNLEYAKRNIQQNNIGDKITGKSTILEFFN